MSTARWERIKELVAEALRLPPAERERFLAAACAGDPALRAEVEELVRAAEGADRTFLQPPGSALPGAAAEPRLLGDFELLREIGRGAMGVVYVARQKSLERTVAVKVLAIGVTTTQRQIERFHREALAVAKLNHPGIVPVFTTGSTAEAHYFAMEYVPGGSLGAELARQRRKEASLMPAFGSGDHVHTCARAVAELADALQYAHEHGIVHRDVKPQNILIGEGGWLRLVDFGLAKDESLGSLSRSGEVAGTPHYMSPEQARARRQAIDHRTDVYSLGVVLYELLTLERPFDGHSAEEVLSQILHKDPLPVRRRNPRVPRDLGVICATAMAKDLRDRYATASAFAADLRRFLRFESIEAKPPGPVRRVRDFARRHSLPVTASSVLVVGVTTGIAWVHARERDAQLEELTALEAVPDWKTLPDERLIRGRRIAAGRDPESVLVQRIDRRFVALHDELRAEGLRLIDEGKRGTPGEESSGVDDARIVTGVLELARLLGLFPEQDDPEVVGLLQTAFYPRVTLRCQGADGTPRSAVASYRVLEPVTDQPGERVVLGPLPIDALAVRPGYYRFVVEPEGEPFHEFARLLLRAQDAAPIVCTVRPGPDPTAGMVLIRGAVVHPRRRAEDQLCPLLDRETPVDDFWIDRTKVSVGQYRAFLAATGTKRPDEWDWLPEDARYDDRPAVAMSWTEAQAYAEWAGKRLVSHPEWDLAARGTDGELFADSEGFRGTVFGPNVRANYEESFRQYLAHTTAVDAPESARGRNGLFHMLGNVHEWTESLGFELLDDGTTYVSRPDVRLKLSSPWYAAALDLTLATMALAGPERRYTNAETGFRCARSGSP